MTINRDFVDSWAGNYPTGYDDQVFKVIGPAVAKRGFYDHAELMQVGKWKANRVTGYLKRNSAEDVREISRLALAAPDHLKHRVLSLLEGVKTPMASALLTVWSPDAFTVIDVRAVDTLKANREVEGWPRYVEYLRICRRLAESCGTDLRTLDRALYRANGATSLP